MHLEPRIVVGGELPVRWRTLPPRVERLATSVVIAMRHFTMNLKNLLSLLAMSTRMPRATPNLSSSRSKVSLMMFHLSFGCPGRTHQLQPLSCGRPPERIAFKPTACRDARISWRAGLSQRALRSRISRAASSDDFGAVGVVKVRGWHRWDIVPEARKHGRSGAHRLYRPTASAANGRRE